MWGLHRLLRPPQRLVLCEGVFDAVWGDDRLAVLGSSLSPRQCENIARLCPREVLIAFDRDAWREAVVAATALARHYCGPIWTVKLPWHADLGELKQTGEKYLSKPERLC